MEGHWWSAHSAAAPQACWCHRGSAPAVPSRCGWSSSRTDPRSAPSPPPHTAHPAGHTHEVKLPSNVFILHYHSPQQPIILRVRVCKAVLPFSPWGWADWWSRRPHRGRRHHCLLAPQLAGAKTADKWIHVRADKYLKKKKKGQVNCFYHRVTHLDDTSNVILLDDDVCHLWCIYMSLQEELDPDTTNVTSVRLLMPNKSQHVRDNSDATH